MSPKGVQITGESHDGRLTAPALKPRQPHVFSISFVLILSFLRVLRVDEVPF